MAVKRDYYDVLGVPRGADDAVIKRAFRRLAQLHHPDVDRGDDAEARFKELNEAYRVLSDRQRRSAYDMFGHAGVEGAAAGGFEGFGGGGFGPFGD
ncbi:MAG: DnaJ domain-containing protein, partial [Chloroflexota bacterium]|nr:DnaJ domain-containing protein [Chloroflexota bacterium]